MERIANFIGAPPARNIPVPQNQNARAVETRAEMPENQMPENMVQQQVAQPRAQEEPERVLILVDRHHQNADQMVIFFYLNNYIF